MKRKYVAGLMSGTSLDGVDAVVMRMRGTGTSTRFNLVSHVAQKYPFRLKNLLLKNSYPETSRVDDIARLNFLLAHIYANALRSAARSAGISLSQIGLIGSHGQTIHHLPKSHRILSRTISATLQIGDPSVLAALTGITTVGDFRVADMAVGGEGAPLVPYFDWLAFRSRTKNRVLLNLGGIANVTILPRNGSLADVTAFDTGPGNMVVDALMQRLYHKPYDRDGRVASRGMVSLDLLRWMNRHPFLKRKPPKSTGREEFGEAFVEMLLRAGRKHDDADIIASASFFTAQSVFDSYAKFVEKRMTADELIISGGGAKNAYIIDALRYQFRDVKFRFSDEFGVPSEAKEAMCFAILANETMAGHPTNLPSVTGAKRSVVLGKICVPGSNTTRIRTKASPSRLLASGTNTRYL